MKILREKERRKEKKIKITIKKNKINLSFLLSLNRCETLTC